MPGRLDRRVEGRRGQARAAHGAADARAAHPPREGDVSNICTAQVLLAVMAGHVRGVARPGRRCARSRGACTRSTARPARRACAASGSTRAATPFFDTLRVRRRRARPRVLAAARRRARINLRAYADGRVGIALDETVTAGEIASVLEAFSGSRLAFGVGRAGDRPAPRSRRRSRGRARSSRIRCSTRTTPSTRCCATCARLEARDLSLTHLDDPARLVHDEAERDRRDDAGHLAGVRRSSTRSRPPTRREGYARCSRSSRAGWREITGFAAVSLQPNAGSQGEYAGLLAIRGYHESRGEAAPQRLPHPRLRARHQPGERGDGGHAGGGRGVRRAGQHRGRRPAQARRTRTRRTWPR